MHSIRWFLFLDDSQHGDVMQDGCAGRQGLLAFYRGTGCRRDLFNVGKMLDEVHRTKFALTDELLLIRDQLLSSLEGPQVVTAENVLSILRPE